MSELHNGWKMVKFGDVVRNVRETADPYAEGIERYVGLGDIEPENLHIRSWGLVEKDGTTFTRRFRAGQVLFAKRRAYQRKAALADFDGVCSHDLLVFEAIEEHLLPELLPFIVQTDAFYEKAIATSAGSLSPRTKWRDLARYEFVLPPLDEQRRIAEILWAADEAEEQWTRAIDSLRALETVVRDRYFSSNNSDTTRLVDLCVENGIQIGPFGSQLHAEDYQDHGVPVIMPSDMDAGSVRTEEIARVAPATAKRLERHKVRTGDILLPRRGDLDKRAYIGPDQDGWLCGTGSIRIRPKGIEISRAIFHALAAPATVAWLTSNAVGTTMLNLNTQIVSSVPISLPQDDELHHVLHIMSKLEQKIVSAVSHLSHTRYLRKVLVNSLTTPVC